MGFELSLDALFVRNVTDGYWPDDKKLNQYTIWSTVDLCSTAGLNAIVTLLIAGKLWWADRKMRQLLPGRPATAQYRKIIRSLIDSGALYSATLVTLVATNWTVVSYEKTTMSIPDKYLEWCLGNCILHYIIR
jgi:hypothetical protein